MDLGGQTMKNDNQCYCGLPAKYARTIGDKIYKYCQTHFDVSEYYYTMWDDNYSHMDNSTLSVLRRTS